MPVVSAADFSPGTGEKIASHMSMMTPAPLMSAHQRSHMPLTPTGPAGRRQGLRHRDKKSQGFVGKIGQE